MTTQRTYTINGRYATPKEYAELASVWLPKMQAERERARGIAVALEQRLARIEALHAPFFWRVGATSTDDRRVDGESDGRDGASSTRCSHCRDLWPCPTLNAARGVTERTVQP